MKFLIPLLLVTTVEAHAQEQYYADALAFRGPVVNAVMYYTTPDGDRRSQAMVAYDTVNNNRTITTYSESVHVNKPVKQEITQNTNGEEVFFYQPIINTVNKYTRENETTLVLTGDAYGPVPTKKVYSYDDKKRINSIIYYNKDKIVSVAQFSYNSNNTVTKEVLNGTFLAGKYVISYDAHHNPLKVMMKEYDQHQTGSSNVTTSEERFVYSYDEHGNYIECTSIYNGKPAWTHHREISYGN